MNRTKLANGILITLGVLLILGALAALVAQTVMYPMAALGGLGAAAFILLVLWAIDNHDF